MCLCAELKRPRPLDVQFTAIISPEACVGHRLLHSNCNVFYPETHRFPPPVSTHDFGDVKVEAPKGSRGRDGSRVPGDGGR